MDSRGEKEIAATAEGGRSHLSTYPVAPTHSPPGTPTSNVVININGAAQYSPDLASPCIYLRSISLLGTERTPLPSSSPRCLLDARMRRAHLATVSGSFVDPTKGYLLGMPRLAQVERVHSPLLSERTKYRMVLVLGNQLSDIGHSTDNVALCSRTVYF